MARAGAASGAATTLLAVALLAVGSLPAAAQSALRWTCVMTRTGEQRLIDLEYATADVVPCLATDRPPGGGARVIADYRGTRGMCERTVESVLRNLARSGYQCGGPTGIGATPDDSPAAVPEPPAEAPPPPPVDASPPPAAPSEESGPEGTATAPEPARTEPVLSAPHAPRAVLPEGSGSFAIASTHVVADLAQRAAAELRLASPFADVRVLAPRPGAAYWSVALAADTSRERAEAIASGARALGVGRLPFVWSFPDDWPEDRRFWLAAADEWQPTVVAACHARGAATVRAMAACSGLAVEADTFAACMTGGVCQPRPVAEAAIADLDDQALPSPPPAEAAYVAPMLATPEAAGACAEIAAAGDATGAAAFVNCMAIAMMEPGQRAILACHATAGDPTAACTGLGGTAEERVMAACLAASPDGPLALVACAGGRITARELARCANLGGDPRDCFGAGGMLAPALRDIAHDVGLLAPDGLPAELEEVAAGIEGGGADAATLRRTLRDLGNRLRQSAAGDPRVAGAFDAVAPRLALP